MARPRQTKLFIAMTMDNKDDSPSTRIMQGVVKNITHLCRDRSKT
jgi:chitin synthase